MKDEIIVDFNALDRIVKKLNTASHDLQSAMSILSSASLSEGNGAYVNLGGVRTSLKSVGGSVSAHTAAQAVYSYGAAIKRLSARSRTLASVVKNASNAYRKTENSSKSQFSGAVTNEDARKSAEGYTAGGGGYSRGGGGAGSFGSGGGGGSRGDCGSTTTEKGSVADWFQRWKNWLNEETAESGSRWQWRARYDDGTTNGEIEVKTLPWEISKKGEARWWKDGKLNPQVIIDVSAIGALIGVTVSGRHGTDNYNIHADGEGQIGYGEVSANLKIGQVEDKDGKTGYGITGKIGAIVAAARGRVKSGVTIFGVDINITARGYAGGVGFTAGVEATTNGVSAGIDYAAGLGGGVSVSVDWSDAMSFQEIREDVSEGVDALVDYLLGFW